MEREKKQGTIRVKKNLWISLVFFMCCLIPSENRADLYPRGIYKNKIYIKSVERSLSLVSDNATRLVIEDILEVFRRQDKVNEDLGIRIEKLEDQNEEIKKLKSQIAELEIKMFQLEIRGYLKR